MNHYQTSMSLLTRALEVRSSGSSGRSLVDRLEQHQVDLLGSSSVVDFAEMLQCRDSVGREAFEEFLEWTNVDDDFVLIALVALAPELHHLASRLSGGFPGEDAISEMIAQATFALRWTHELVEGERIEFVLNHAFSRTRSEKRRMARHNVPTCSLIAGDDVASWQEASYEVPVGLLARAVAQRVVTVDEAHLIESTRLRKESIYELAFATGCSYDALRMRRNRAEDQLRKYFTESGDLR